MGTAYRIDRENHFACFCDFCGATQEESAILIAAPYGPHICDQCVDVSAEMVEKKRMARAMEGRDG